MTRLATKIIVFIACYALSGLALSSTLQPYFDRTEHPSCGKLAETPVQYSSCRWDPTVLAVLGEQKAECYTDARMEVVGVRQEYDVCPNVFEATTWHRLRDWPSKPQHDDIHRLIKAMLPIIRQASAFTEPACVSKLPKSYEKKGDFEAFVACERERQEHYEQHLSENKLAITVIRIQNLVDKADLTVPATVLALRKLTLLFEDQGVSFDEAEVDALLATLKGA